MLQIQRYISISLFVISGLIVSAGIIVFAKDQSLKVDSIVEKNIIIGDQNEALFLFAEKQPSYTSKIMNAKFAFEAIGFKVNGDIPQGTDIIFKARFEQEKKWTNWTIIDLKKIEKQNFYASEEPIFIHDANKFQYSINFSSNNTQAISKIESIESIYFYSPLSPIAGIHKSIVKKIKNFNLTANADSEIKIITRAEWGADESYRMTASGKELWPSEISVPEKFIIHHTAGSDGGTNSSATIRGIYYWHARVLGWGDIGYNFIIDAQGNMYEGRYGGNGVVGAHAYNSETNTNHNIKSIGIAVLGCFESTAGACSTLNIFNEAEKESLVRLIQNKAKLWNIEPNAAAEWHGQKLPNIIGHKDVDKTYCPGDQFYNLFPDIRLRAQASYAQAFQAEYFEQNLRDKDFVDSVRDATVKIKNIGTETWSRDASYLEVFDSGYKISRYKHASWKNNYGHFSFQEQEVKSGEFATLAFKIQNPNEPGTFDHIWKFTANNHSVANNEKILQTQVVALYQAEFAASNMRPAYSSRWQPKITVRLKNIGSVAWTRRMVLEIYGEKGSSSLFSHPFWPNKKIGEIPLKQRTIQPGAIGTFEFRIKPPKQTGVYQLQYKLKVKGKDFVIQQSNMSWKVRVD